MTKLSVNVNKLATLRNSRGKNNPDLLRWTQEIVEFGAHGITVHPRPDERHIRKTDAVEIAKNIAVEFNIEGFPDPSYMKLVSDLRPAQATLVPDPPHVLTSNAGWDLKTQFGQLKPILTELKNLGIRTSIFIDPFTMNEESFQYLDQLRPDRVELYTESYAVAFPTSRRKDVTEVYRMVAEECLLLNIDLNAGHDLDLDNLRHFVRTVPQIKEVSIGHALICDALRYGMKDTIRRYLECLGGDPLCP